LVSSLSFPHLWKKLWKLGQNAKPLRVVAEFAGVLREAKAAKGRKIGLSKA
jgi:hypothetical protein